MIDWLDSRMVKPLRIWRRWQHAEQVGGQTPAGAPVLQADDVPVGWIKLAQAEIGFLGHDDLRVVVLKPNPGDVRFGVVVSVYPHNAASVGSTRFDTA